MHAPSKEVIREGRVVLFEEERVKNMDNVLPGAAAPLAFEGKMIGVVGIIGPPKEVKPYVYLVKQYIEMMWQETIYRQLESLKNKNLETFAQYILLNEAINNQRVKQYCEMMDISFDANRFCIVIDIGDPLMELDDLTMQLHLDDLQEKLIELTRSSYQCDSHSICTFLNTGKIVLLKTVESEKEYEVAIQQFYSQSIKLQELYQIYNITDITVAAGNLSSSLQDIHTSYMEAERLIDYGKKLCIMPRVYSYHHWKMLISLLPEQISSSFIEKINWKLKSFASDDKFIEMAKTFIVYCKTNLNISQAAKELFVHRNTLIYRLQKIESMTGLDSKKFDDCTLLYLWLLRNYKELVVEM